MSIRTTVLSLNSGHSITPEGHPTSMSRAPLPSALGPPVTGPSLDEIARSWRLRLGRGTGHSAVRAAPRRGPGQGRAAPCRVGAPVHPRAASRAAVWRVCSTLSRSRRASPADGRETRGLGLRLRGGGRAQHAVPSPKVPCARKGQPRVWPGESRGTPSERRFPFGFGEQHGGRWRRPSLRPGGQAPVLSLTAGQGSAPGPPTGFSCT